MANIVNFSNYGFLNDILALSQDNWRHFFKPSIYDSVQYGLEVSQGTGMTVNVSAGECRCGAIMGELSGNVVLDIDDAPDYGRIDSVVAQYSFNNNSPVLSLAIVKGTPSSNPSPPSISKLFYSLYQIELAQIFVPRNAHMSSQFTITDKRVTYNSLDDIKSELNNKVDKNAPATVAPYTWMEEEWVTNFSCFTACITASDNSTKKIQIPDYKLLPNGDPFFGSTVFVKFNNANTATNPTLTINSGNPKPIMRYGTTKIGATSSVDSWAAGAVLALTYDGTNWIEHYWYNLNYTAYCQTSAVTAAKKADCASYSRRKGYVVVIIKNTNAVEGKITLNINGAGAGDVYLNGAITSSSNNNLQSGMYIVYCDGTNYYFRNDGRIEGLAPENLYYTGVACSAQTNAVFARIPAGSGTDSKITADTIVLKCNFSKPETITSDVTWTSYAGYIELSGTCTDGTCTADLILSQKGN